MTSITIDNILDHVFDPCITARIIALKETDDWYALETHEVAVDFLASYAARTEWFIRHCNNSELLEIYRKVTKLFENKTKISSADFLEDPVIHYTYICNGSMVMVDLNEDSL